MNFERLNEIAAHLMIDRQSHKERETGSVYFHGQRASKGVLSLRKAVLPGDSSHDDILRAAAIFHDVGKGLEPHNVYGALITREALKDEVLPEELEEIARIIEAHCDRKPGTDTHDLWCKLMQDADLLDHFGAQDIWNIVYYSAYEKTGLDAAVQYFQEHWESFMQEHRGLLNFDLSIAIYDEKMRYERQFAERLYVEAQGEYIVTGQ